MECKITVNSWDKCKTFESNKVTKNIGKLEFGFGEKSGNYNIERKTFYKHICEGPLRNYYFGLGE